MLGADRTDAQDVVTGQGGRNLLLQGRRFGDTGAKTAIEGQCRVVRDAEVRRLEEPHPGLAAQDQGQNAGEPAVVAAKGDDHFAGASMRCEGAVEMSQPERMLKGRGVAGVEERQVFVAGEVETIFALNPDNAVSLVPILA